MKVSSLLQSPTPRHFVWLRAYQLPLAPFSSPPHISVSSMLIKTVLFETDGVALFKIPPGDARLRNWNPAHVVWNGSLRLTEQEDTAAVDGGDVPPQLSLRLKLELFNRLDSGLLLLEFADLATEVLWAEVWYNPLCDSPLANCIANDHSDTLEMSAESAKYYRVVAQLPGTGYHPFRDTDKGFLLQVALGLHLRDQATAAAFSESVALYRRHFRSFQEKYACDDRLASLQLKLVAGFNILQNSPGPDFDDEEFGSFVGASYD